MSFIVQWLYILTLSLWVGSIFFFSFLTTPTVFATLPREMASQLISAIFPRYYTLGYVAGGVLLLTTLLEAILVKQLPWVRIVLVLLMLGSTLYAGMMVRPLVHDLKVEMKTVEEGTPRGKDLKAKFDSQHRLSVILNLIVLISGLFLIGILAFRLRL
ncbi:MAG: DUF4149 domain-containing protein [bacterium]|nr:DUF4149 domain-containing protein [bacterium]